MKKKKFIILWLAAIVLIAFIGLLVYLSKTGKISPLAAGNAAITLQPSSQTVSVGQTFDVNIYVDTDGEALAGIDVFYLNYDPGVLEVQDADSNQAGVQIRNGTIFPIYMGEPVDSHPGKIAHSGMVQIQQGSPGWSGTGIFATVTFKALSVSESTRLYFDFTPGAENDTNFTSINGGDVLASVGEALFTVTGSGGPTHMVCDTKAQVCQTVDGAGENECAANADCQPATHTVCNAGTQTCDTIQGAGTNECSSNTECQAVTHTICNSDTKTCDTIQGGGSNQCTSDSQCEVAPPPSPGTGQHHHVCDLSKKACITLKGPGSDQCATFNDCIITATPTPTPEETPPVEPETTQTPESVALTTPTENPPTTIEPSPIPSSEFFQSPEISSSPEVVVAAGKGISKPLLVVLVVISIVLLTVIGFFVWGSKGPKQNDESI